MNDPVQIILAMFSPVRTDTERQQINRKVPSLLAYFGEELAFCSQHPHMPLNGKFSVSVGLCIMVVNSM